LAGESDVSGPVGRILKQEAGALRGCTEAAAMGGLGAAGLAAGRLCLAHDGDAVRGDPQAARLRLQALEGLPMLAVDSQVAALAQRLVRPGALPVRAADDAVHLSICAVHRVPLLLTWNFRHLANDALRARLASICNAAGFDLPIICSPDELP
jgi:hypothetical protein